MDLIFPHHERDCAVVFRAPDGSLMHNMITINGQKMGKSLQLHHPEQFFTGNHDSLGAGLFANDHPFLHPLCSLPQHRRFLRRCLEGQDGKEYLMRRISSKGQDAFAAGYHHKYSESVSYRFVSKGNGYLIMNHLYYYTPRNPNARIIIKASDPYGNTYTASSDEVTTEPFANYAHYYEQENKEPVSQAR